MTAKQTIDYFKVLLDIFNSKYPEIDCKVNFTKGLNKKAGLASLTVFKRDSINIYIDTEFSFEDTMEFLVIELTEVATGCVRCIDQSKKPLPEWVAVYTWLNQAFSDNCAKFTKLH